MANPILGKESALFTKWKSDLADWENKVKLAEEEDWNKNKDTYIAQGYTREKDPNNTWGSKWSKKETETEIENVNPYTEEAAVKSRSSQKNPAPTFKTRIINGQETSVNPDIVDQEIQDTPSIQQKSTGFNLEQFRLNQGLKSTDYINHNGSKYLRYDPDGFGDFYIGMNGDIYQANYGGGLGNKLDYTQMNKNHAGKLLSNFNSLYNIIGAFTVPTNKQGGTMNKVKYFAQGGQPQTQNDIQRQVEALVEAAMSGDQKATQQVNQIMEAAKAGDQKAAQLAQMIQMAAQKLQGQATAAKWGSKLQYIKSLKFAKGGKTCPVCEGGDKVKVAKKDVDTKTYQKQSFAKKAELDEHRLGTETSANKNGSYNTSHKPSAQDSTTIHRSTMSADMNKMYPRVKSKACGGAAPKAKKHYFGGWL